MARGVGREKVRKLLGLAVWEVELAAETDLLRRLPDRTFDPVSVNAAQSDAEHFRRLLAAEYRCNATQAGARLGISAERFKQIAADLTPVAVEEVRKYGRTLVVRYYRAADVDGLAYHARADAELRAAARSYSRSEAARKAARTRKLNLVRAETARAAIEAAKPAPDGDPAQVLVWTAALMEVVGVWPGPLQRLRLIVDPHVPPLIATLREARLPRAELEAMLTALLTRAPELIATLVAPKAAEWKLGVPVDKTPADLPRFGDHLFAGILHELVSAPPPWLLQARADQELQRAALAEACRTATEATRRHQAEQVIVDAAIRAASQLGDASVAGIFGLPVEMIRLLRPKSGRWSAEHVAGLLRNTPPWLRTESAARVEADRRRRHAENRAAQLAERRLSWRRRWAEVFGVPLDQVPQATGRPTRRAIEAVKRESPDWSRRPSSG
ncbi:hypothetical protein [Microtetraspora fusca]|uniref:hypothetical protein n=1 Tax=Microtetraspora fusca TaxID=1997 RepID=UPI000B177864|nr:hypothetical protein [Microtetraspora fusca]